MELGGGGPLSGTEIQIRTAGMTVWRDDHYSIATMNQHVWGKMHTVLDEEGSYHMEEQYGTTSFHFLVGNDWEVYKQKLEFVHLREQKWTEMILNLGNSLLLQLGYVHRYKKNLVLILWAQNIIICYVKIIKSYILKSLPRDFKMH